MKLSNLYKSRLAIVKHYSTRTHRNCSIKGRIKIGHCEKTGAFLGHHAFLETSITSFASTFHLNAAPLSSATFTTIYYQFFRRIKAPFPSSRCKCEISVTLTVHDSTLKTCSPFHLLPKNNHWRHGMWLMTTS